LAVVGREAVLYGIGVGAMVTGNRFGNHADTPAQLSHHSCLAHYSTMYGKQIDAGFLYLPLDDPSLGTRVSVRARSAGVA